MKCLRWIMPGARKLLRIHYQYTWNCSTFEKTPKSLEKRGENGLEDPMKSLGFRFDFSWDHKVGKRANGRGNVLLINF